MSIPEQIIVLSIVMLALMIASSLRNHTQVNDEQ